LASTSPLAMSLPTASPELQALPADPERCWAGFCEGIADRPAPGEHPIAEFLLGRLPPDSVLLAPRPPNPQIATIALPKGQADRALAQANARRSPTGRRSAAHSKSPKGPIGPFDCRRSGIPQPIKNNEEISLHWQGGYTEFSPPKIPIWGVRRTIWPPNHPPGGVRRKYFRLRSDLGVLCGTHSV
jgi:hypothetical protein